MIVFTEFTTAVILIASVFNQSHIVVGVRGQLPTLNFSRSENVLTKSIGRKGIFAIKFRKPGLTEQNKAVSE